MENLSAEFKTEGQPAFPVENKEKENSSESPTGTELKSEQTHSKEGEQTPAINKDDGKEENIPFHKHPRWKELNEGWKNRFNSQEERHQEDLKKLREDFEGRFQKSKPAESVKIPNWFGGDEEAWNQYQEHQQQLVKQAEENAFNKVTQQQKEQAQATKEANDYFDSQISEIESDSELNPEGNPISQNEKNKLLKFLSDQNDKGVLILDNKNRWNYKAAYEMMRARNVENVTDSIEEKKKVARATISDNRSEEKPKSFKTANDFKGKNWGSL